MKREEKKKNELKACHRISFRMNSFLIMFESSLKILPINLEFCHQQRRMPKQVHFFVFVVVEINCDLFEAFDRSLFEKSMNRSLFKRKTNRYKKKTAKTFNLKPCFECSADAVRFQSNTPSK